MIKGAFPIFNPGTFLIFNPPWRGRLPAAALLLFLAAGGGHFACAPSSTPSERPSIPVADVLAGGGRDGFARALAPRPFMFPDDHGPHPDFRHEWWYFTGNLEDLAGKEFGFQVTFFRVGLVAEQVPGPSAWRTRDVYMAHLAVTDIRGNGFSSYERFGRGALGIAGASARPFRVWIDDWSAHGSGKDGFPVRLAARQGDAGVDLTLVPRKPVVLQGDRGLSRKGGEEGNASYYYSYTRLDARGTILFAGRLHAVAGEAWFDREWGTSALSRDQAGWDWFALQLADGRDLMIYRLRRKDGTASPESRGTAVGADGRYRSLTPDGFSVEATGRWESPRSGAAYPAGWRIVVPSEGLDLEVAPRVADQELPALVVYWEGAVEVRDAARGGTPFGRGYAELTGYASPVPGR